MTDNKPNYGPWADDDPDYGEGDTNTEEDRAYAARIAADDAIYGPERQNAGKRNTRPASQLTVSELWAINKRNVRKP